MTGLIVAGCILGYLLCGVGAMRTYWRLRAVHSLAKSPAYLYDIDLTEKQVIAANIGIFWPLAIAAAALGAIGYGMWRLASMPTRRERLEARAKTARERYERCQAEIARLEREQLR